MVVIIRIITGAGSEVRRLCEHGYVALLRISAIISLVSDSFLAQLRVAFYIAGGEGSEVKR